MNIEKNAKKEHQFLKKLLKTMVNTEMVAIHGRNNIPLSKLNLDPSIRLELPNKIPFHHRNEKNFPTIKPTKIESQILP
jgi:hypothetical protein